MIGRNRRVPAPPAPPVSPMRRPDPEVLAQVGRDLAKFSAFLDRCVENAALGITANGYEAGVVSCWEWLQALPDEQSGWLAAVALARLARQHLDGEKPPGK